MPRADTTTAAPPPSREALHCYLSDLNRYSRVTPVEEQRLARRIRRGDGRALHRLVEANLNFVILISRQYTGMGLPLEDLLNEGNIGLIEAARRFDPERNIRFITYAVWWIRRSIMQALSEHSRLVRLPKYKIKELREFKRQYRELTSTLKRAPERADVSRATGRSESEISDLMTLEGIEVSLDAPRSVTDSPLLETIVGTDAKQIDVALVRKEVSRKVQWAMSRLSERERRILAYRYGFHGDHAMTLEEIGDRMQLTKERVRQIEILARKRMRNILLSQKEELQVAAC